MSQTELLITSLQNPKVKAIVGLREKRERLKTGLVAVEGYDELSVAAQNSKPIELYFCPAMFQPAQKGLVEKLRRQGAALIEVSDKVFEKMAYRDNPDGWLATFATPQKPLDRLQLSDNPFIVVGESVEKPGNLGAILRTADAANVDAVISCDPLTDWGNPNIVRASKGTVFTVQVSEAKSKETIAWLRERGIKIIVATPQATMQHTAVDLTGPVAITVGTERTGLSQLWFDSADESVVIPMYGKVNSLNVSTSTAILLYEVVRQRTLHQSNNPR
jgi:RNA methyltransferase, TrmH family